MNIIAIQLVLVRTKPGLVVMCIYPHSSCVFYCMPVNSTFLDCKSLPFVLMHAKHIKFICSIHTVQLNRTSCIQVLNVHSVDGEVLRDFHNGILFTQHKLFSADPHTLQTILYFDKLELCYPLSTSAKHTKLVNLHKINTELIHD